MLYICATPIGNLDDVTLRVLHVLRSADVILCEDTRHTGGLLRRHEVTPHSLLSFHEHNEEARLERVLALLAEGKDVALVSDAGLPGLSDPGFTLVRAAAEAGFDLTVLPGASAVPTALVASGLPTDRFVFVGFIPRGKAKVVGFLEEAGRAGGSVVAFESPHRLRATLEAVGARWPDRLVAVCRELTKVHEQVLRGTSGQVLDALDLPVRGEVVLVLAPSEAAGGASAASRGAPPREPEHVQEALAALLARGFRTKEAADLVAGLTGLDRRTVYAAAQEAKTRLA